MNEKMLEYQFWEFVWECKFYLKKGYEVEETKGLGFLDGEVVFMDIDEKVPHMGWNQLHFNQNHPILKKYS